MNIVYWDGCSETANLHLGEDYGIDWEYKSADSQSIAIKREGFATLTCAVGEYLVFLCNDTLAIGKGCLAQVVLNYELGETVVGSGLEEFIDPLVCRTRASNGEQVIDNSDLALIMLKAITAGLNVTLPSTFKLQVI